MRKKNIKENGFSLVEVIIGITLFTIFMTSIIFCFSTLVRLEIKSKENLYKKIDESNEISKKYYISKDYK
jgi:prepilin-type N-terminal cleavage/methylation domain-containing protein